MRTFLIGCLIFIGINYQRVNPESNNGMSPDSKDGLAVLLAGGMIAAIVQDLKEIFR